MAEARAGLHPFHATFASLNPLTPRSRGTGLCTDTQRAVPARDRSRR